MLNIQKNASGMSHVIDNSIPTTFTTPRSFPVEFSNPASATNDLPGLRVLNQRLLHFPVFIIAQVILDEPGKHPCFNETEHILIIRHCRIASRKIPNLPESGLMFDQEDQNSGSLCRPSSRYSPYQNLSRPKSRDPGQAPRAEFGVCLTSGWIPDRAPKAGLSGMTAMKARRLCKPH